MASKMPTPIFPPYVHTISGTSKPIYGPVTTFHPSIQPKFASSDQIQSAISNAKQRENQRIEECKKKLNQININMTENYK